MMSGFDQLDDLLDRVDRMCNGDTSPDDLARLEHLACIDKDLCWAYICYSHVHAGLRWAPVELPSLAGEEETATPIDHTLVANQPTTKSALFPSSPTPSTTPSAISPRACRWPTCLRQ